MAFSGTYGSGGKRLTSGLTRKLGRRSDGRTPGLPPVVANVWVDPTFGNDGTGTRSGSLIQYGTSNPYKSVHAANTASQGGDIVAFMPGIYSPVNNPAGGWETLTDDASDGAGNDVNPNSVEQGLGAVATPTNWVRWIPGVNNAAKDSIQLVPYSNPRLAFFANMHLIIDSSPSPGAFFIPCINFGWTVADGRMGQNVITKNIHVQGVGIRHSKNIWMQDTEIGPNVYGAASGFGAILSSGSPIGTYETGYAGRGTGDLDEFQAPKITENATNVRMDRTWNHDRQSRDSISFHTGVAWISNGPGWPDANIIIDSMVSERITHNGILLENGTDGVWLQNCWFGETVVPLDQTSVWGTPAPDAYQLVVKLSTNPSYVWKNLLIRYCVFERGATVEPGEFDFLNWRFIGNVFGPLGLNVETYSGKWTVDRNAFVGATHGTNSLNITALSDHYTDIDPGIVPASTSQLDLHLTPGAKAFENWVPSSADADIPLDIFGTPRTAPRTAGPHQR